MKISEIRFSVIVHEGENYDEIKKKFLDLLNGVDLKKVEIFENIGEGLFSSKLYYISAKIKRKKDMERFIKNLIKRGLDIEGILRSMGFDERFNIYIRFDKRSLLEENKIVPLYGDDVFHLKISIDGYKKSKEKVIEFLKEYFEKISNL